MRQLENYHKHSYMTNPIIPDSVVSPEAYAIRCKELGCKVLSSCEHGWQGSPWEYWRLAQEYGLKYLMSAEAYWVKDRTEKDPANCHIWLGAKNENGREALNDILSEASITGKYIRNRVDIPLILSLPRDDVWVTSACVKGWDYEDAEEIFKRFSDHFRENFFLEVQNHDTDAQARLNERILNLRNQTGMQLIAGCDSHYIFPDQAQNREDFLFSKGIHYPQEEGWYLDFPDGDTVYQRFAKQSVLSGAEIEEAINNTLIFQNVCEYDGEIFNSEIKMPSLYPEKTQKERDEIYKKLVWSGWDNYKDQVPKERWPEYEKEIQSEIDVVEETKMADYFIDNYHIIRQGKENGGHLTTTGRGCVKAGAIVNTTDGEKLIEDIQVGDTVFNMYGNPQKVLNTFVYHINEPTITIERYYATDGRECTFTTDHKILVHRGGENIWVPAKYVDYEDYLVMPRKTFREYGLDFNAPIKDFRARINDDYIYIPILSITMNPTEEIDVYDFEVENTHSYMLNGCVIHNSAVSFITNKLLGFTEVDRIEAPVKMYPERFMSATRILQSGSLPD